MPSDDLERQHAAPRRIASSLWTSGLALILLVTLARLVYLAWFSPYTLIEDEAHYWEWSRRLELSYYSKGPGIAWVIRAATELFGTSEWAIRLPAVISSAIGAFCVAGLARDICNHPNGSHSSPRNSAGLYAATIYLAMPAFWVLGIIITIDGPYLASWAAACWAAWRALTTNAPRAWAALGLALALGFTFKYTILLLLPGLALAAWLARRDTRARSANRARSASEEPKCPGDAVSAGIAGDGSSLALRARWRLGPGPLLAIAIASLGLLPVILWNIQHDWITVQHLLGHLGVKGGDITPAPDEHWSPLWSLELLGIQLGLAGPAILLAIYSFICARREHNEHPDLWRAARFLACCGLPILGFYFLVSLIAEPEGNWPLAAWVSAAPLGAIGLVRVFPEFRRRVAAWRDNGSPGVRPHMHRVMMWRWTVGLGIIVALGFARADWLVRLPILGPLVPQGRLMFADVRAADATRILNDLRTETGLEPFVMAQHYGRTSQLAYYLPAQPTVYCAGASMDGPKKQYDLWPETNLANPETLARLAGRPALLVGGRFEQWVPAFERVVKIGQLDGEHKKGRLIYLGYNYQGFPATRPADPSLALRARFALRARRSGTHP
ncbi:MAG: glycosyltransferase family 39 protein [Planctomycetota bacterium]|nr:glycosyltransferase family 39 protein [Planctomycetota bacterium]